MRVYVIKNIDTDYYFKENNGLYFSFINLPYATFFTEFGANDMMNFIKNNEWKFGKYNLKIVEVEIREVE